ncbi:MAG: glycosyltransferase family 2 protein [Bacteroidia bacterium]|jgi:glycosyltransferase involved in cell wall biosynthesis|nr:glycosyltransferase family 2 protein [Bacteroidia bacterium]
MKPNISLFFPVYNDENTIERMVLKSIDVLKEVAEKYEIIIINDGSPDNSGSIADQMASTYTNIVVIHHKQNKGYGAAIKSGFENASYEWVCFTDGDDEYDVYDLKKMIALKDFYDLIITFRYVKLYSNFRIFVSGIYNKLFRLIFRTNYRDISTGLRLMKKSVFNDLTIISDSPFIGAEITLRTMLKGYRVGEMGIQTFPREFGSGASVSFKNIIKTLKDMSQVYKHIFSANYDLPEKRNRIK